LISVSLIWQNEWKNYWGGNSFFNCGTSDSRGVGILLGKKFKENVEFFSQDNSGRILRSTLKINDSTFYISNIYAPNNGKERKSCFNAINDTLFKYTDDSDKIYRPLESLVPQLKKLLPPPQFVHSICHRIKSSFVE
jgi:exonuclease III